MALDERPITILLVVIRDVASGHVTSQVLTARRAVDEVVDDRYAKLAGIEVAAVEL